MDRQDKDSQPQDQTEPELPLVTPAFDPLTEPELPLQAEAAASATGEPADGQAAPPLGTEALQATLEAKPKTALPMQKVAPSWAEGGGANAEAGAIMGPNRSRPARSCRRSGAESDRRSDEVGAAHLAAEVTSGCRDADPERHLAARATDRAHDAGLAAIGLWRARFPATGSPRRADAVRVEADADRAQRGSTSRRQLRPPSRQDCAPCVYIGSDCAASHSTARNRAASDSLTRNCDVANSAALASGARDHAIPTGATRSSSKRAENARRRGVDQDGAARRRGADQDGAARRRGVNDHRAARGVDQDSS